MPGSRPDPTLLDGRPSLAELVPLRLPLVMLSSLQSEPPWEPPLLPEPLPERVTRGILFARLANLIEGHGATSLRIVEAVIDMLNGARPIPPGRGLQYRLEAAGARLVFGLFRLLPLDTASALGGFLARLVGPLLGVSKRAVLNIRRAMPEVVSADSRSCPLFPR